MAISTILRDISERHKTEQSRALLASIVESSEDAIVATSPDGTIVSWNRGAQELFGYLSHEIIGRNAEILTPPDCGERSGIFASKGNGTSLSPFETVCYRKDGNPIHIALCTSPIRNPAGDIVGSSAIARDIGKSLLAARKLQESEERFRGVFEQAPFGMYVSGWDGRIVQVNAAFCRMLGYSEQELLAKTWPELIHDDELGAALRRKEQVWKQPGGSVDGESRYVHRSGCVVWGRLRVSLLRDTNGNPSHSIVHVEDITERKHTEDALHESEDRFRITADGCPTIMFVTDAVGETQFINRAYREFCGTTSEDVVGGKWQALVHPDDVLEYAEAFQHAVREHVPFSREVRIRRADGEWRWLASYAEPRLSSSGEYLGHVGLCPDVTERREGEQAIRDSREFAQATIDALSSHVCVLNEAGTIIAVNQAWKDFAKANQRMDSDECGTEFRCVDSYGEGANYLATCDRAVGAQATDASEFADGIRSVLHGNCEHYEQEYPCHSPFERRWFIARVRRFSINRLPRILIEHVIITERKLYEEKLIHAQRIRGRPQALLKGSIAGNPWARVLGAVSLFLTEQFPGSDCCIHLSVSRTFCNWFPNPASSPDLALRLARIAIAAKGEICARGYRFQAHGGLRAKARVFVARLRERASLGYHLRLSSQIAASRLSRQEIWILPGNLWHWPSLTAVASTTGLPTSLNTIP